MNCLIVIPARGGSKGIPRKNLRILNGYPLIYYSIRTAKSLSFDCDIYVSSDDQEIRTMAERFGAKTINRNPELAGDSVTLDSVIYDCYQQAKFIEKKVYDLIITMQPTSPLLKKKSIENAIQKMSTKPEIETIISVVDDRHLTWTRAEGKCTPNYKERVNRQYLPSNFKETGGVLITRNTVISETNRIGKNIELLELNDEEGIDIDKYSDWVLCEYYLKNKKILFVVAGNSVIGLGHVYNTLALANEILTHQITFLVEKGSELAFETISSFNYPVLFQKKENILHDIFEHNPDVVINDRLDTSIEYVSQLKGRGFSVINIEDLGMGAALADGVINAMYPEKEIKPGHYFGHKYFCLRDEFLLTKKVNEIKNEVKNVLLTFGGVDPNNFTKRIVEIIYHYCIQYNIEITIVLGLGYRKEETLKDFPEIRILKNIKNISEAMLTTDLAFTSAGRTTFEVASLGLPSIVLCQNERETTHFFAYPNYGFVNLGLGALVDDKKIFDTFVRLVNSRDERQQMAQLMLDADLKNGKNRVLEIVQKIVESA